MRISKSNLLLFFHTLFILNSFNGYSQNVTLTFNPGNVEYNNIVGPGDTIFIQGNFTNLFFKNLQGTSNEPIVIINKGGKAKLDGGTYCLKLHYCKNIIIDGSGVSNYEYGFYLINGHIGIEISGYSTDIEIKNVELFNIGFAGIIAKTDNYLTNENWVNKDPNFVMKNMKFHHNYIHKVEGEGYYVGNSFYPVHHYKDGKPSEPQHKISNVQIYDNRTDSTGREGIQIDACPDDPGIIPCKVYDNLVTNTGLMKPPIQNDQINGIQLGDGFSGECFNNYVKNAKGNGIIILGVHGNVKVYNNVILNSKAGLFYIGPGQDTPSGERPLRNGSIIDIFNNTFSANGNTTNDGYAGINLATKNVQVNIINNIGLISPIDVSSKKIKEDNVIDGNILYSNNIFTSNSNYFSDDVFHLNSAFIPNSNNPPAINGGVDPSTTRIGYSINFDYDMNIRPKGTYDVGAYEYSSIVNTCYPTASISPIGFNGGLPIDSIIFSGKNSNDPCGGSIISYEWSFLPNSTYPLPNINSTNQQDINLSNIKAGIYYLKLKVFNSAGNQSESLVKINIDYPTPVSNAGPDQNLTSYFTYIFGQGTDPADGILSYSWRKISGPNSYNTNNTNTNDTLFLTGLVKGTYQFELTVTTEGNTSAKDTVNVTVDVPAFNDAPIAIIKSLQPTITLPANTNTLIGSQSSDPDGTIVSYRWGIESNPFCPTCSNVDLVTNDTLNVSGLTYGSHIFSLTVTDDSGTTSTAYTTVTVKLPKPTANAGPNKTLDFPENSVILSGSGSTTYGTINQYLWKKISGPTDPELTGRDNDTLVINNLKEGTYIFSLVVIDSYGQQSQEDQVNVIVNGRVFNEILYRLNCGGVELSGDPVWEEDRQTNPSEFLDGTSGNVSTGSLFWTPDSTKTNNTAAPDNLFGGHRYIFSYQNPIKYNFPVDPGFYKVNLFFAAKNGSEGDAIGERQFNVKLEDQYYLKNYDVYKDGQFNAIKKTFSIKVLDSTLSIILERGNVGSPQINGIEIIGLFENQNPIANAGSDKKVYLPVNYTTLSGSGNDVDGQIVSYNWTKVSGGTATLTGTSNQNLQISNLSEGLYAFKLTVTDNNGATGSDTAFVTIYPLDTIQTPLILYRVNCGGNEISDEHKNWTRDQQLSPSSYLSSTSGNFSTGTLTWNATDGSNNTGFPNHLFGSQRYQRSYAGPVIYNFPVDNGKHTITLLFKVNTASGTVDQIGKRVFDVIIEKQKKLSNFDIRQQAGINAYAVSFETDVFDNYVTIELVSIIGDAQINGIQIMKYTTSNPTGEPNYTLAYRINAGGATEITDDDMNWAKDSQSNPSGYMDSSSPSATTGSNTWTPDSTKSNNTGAPNNIFGSQRYQPAWSHDTLTVKYHFPIKNGLTKVNLYFATKLGSEGDAIGERVFNVYLEGSLESSIFELDIYKVAGLNALVKTQYVDVKDGILDIEFFRGDAGNPQINGIEIYSASGTFPSSNQAPEVNAGADKIIYYPQTSLNINASANDIDGSIATYTWTKISGPSVTMSSINTASLGLSNLISGVYNFKITVLDDDGATNSDTIQVNVLSPIYRVNCGGVHINDNPIPWQEDRKYQVESPYLDSSSYTLTTGSSFWNGINQTTAPDNLFGGNRYNPSGEEMKWHFPVTNGPVRVRLFFAVKTGSTQDAIGSRVFNVYIENHKYLSNFDIMANAGMQGIMREFTLNVNDGILDLHFEKISGEPQINAIEIIAKGTSSSGSRMVSNNSLEFEMEQKFGDNANDLEITLDDKVIHIYPNPSDNILNVELQNFLHEKVNIEVIDLSGKVVNKVFEGEIQQTFSSVQTNLSYLPKGLYVCRIVTTKDTYSNKIILK